MRRRWTIGLVATGIVIVGAIILAVTHDPDPVYEGRYLSEWLKAYSFGPEHSREGAKRALYALDQTALPLMVKWIAYEPSIWRSRMRELANRWPRVPMPQSVRNYMGTDTRKGRAYDALLGFEAFAPVKTNFGPALVRIANDPSRGESAAMALAILEWGFFADKTFASQVTNDNARQLMGGLGTSTW